MPKKTALIDISRNFALTFLSNRVLERFDCAAVLKPTRVNRVPCGMTVWAALVAIVCVAVFIWVWFVPSKKPWTASERAKAEENRILGALVGAMGGDINNAVIARYALDRFEAQHGRKATMNDLGVLLGMISQQS